MTELNQIEEIEKLCSKTKTYKIPKNPKEGQIQANIQIMPLGIDDISYMDFKKDAPLEEASKKTKALISKSLGISKEQVERLSFSSMEEIMDCIMDANDLDDKGVKGDGIKSFLDKKRELIKKEQELKDNGSAGRLKE